MIFESERITARQRTKISPWVQLVAKQVVDANGTSMGEYHSLKVSDYVSILALTNDRLIPLVKQFRPAVERTTIEFPGGLLDPGEEPASCAARELAEEAGFYAEELQTLGPTLPDAGRLGNRMWCFFAPEVEPITTWTPEPGVEVCFVDTDGLRDLIVTGDFDHAPHLALYALALSRDLI